MVFGSYLHRGLKSVEHLVARALRQRGAVGACRQSAAIQAAALSMSVPDGFVEVVEGEARILQQGNEAFYNKAQVQNRDLSLAVLREYFALREDEVARNVAPRHLRKRRLKKGEGDKGTDGAGGEGTGDGKEEEAWVTPDIRLRVFEGLAATGLRSIRYAKELGDGILREVVCNDMDKEAVKSIERNVEHNGEVAQRLVTPSQGDARIHMLQTASEAAATRAPVAFDVVDLDPYGAPVQLLDSAVQAVSDGGLLMVTATDMAVLCGNNGEACFAKYGSYPLHRPYGHEQAIRILLASIETHAARHKRHIVPLLGVHMDFYVRVFVRVYSGAQLSKTAASRLATVYQSLGCSSFFLQRVGECTKREKSIKYTASRGPVVPQQCPETGSGFSVGGPIWADPIHDQDFVARLLDHVEGSPEGMYPSKSRIGAVLTNVAEELPDCPLYFDMHDLCGLLHVSPPKSELLRSAIVNAGYRVSSTHTNSRGVKTDAPWSIIWDIMRCWYKQAQGVLPRPRQPQEGSHVAKLLAKEPSLEASFARNTAALSAARVAGKSRFPDNPEEHWGPQRRHGKPALMGHAFDRSQKRKAAEGGDAEDSGPEAKKPCV